MPKYFDFEISLLDIQPSIWRRIQLVAVSSFETLHDAIQDAFGWQRQNLYEFRHIDESGSVRTKSSQPVRRIARCKQAEILDDVVVPFADDLPLVSFFAEKKDRCLYLYDFGDNWQHCVELKDVVDMPEEFTCRLLDGARACPPEDCGGTMGSNLKSSTWRLFANGLTYDSSLLILTSDPQETHPITEEEDREPCKHNTQDAIHVNVSSTLQESA